MLAPTKRKKRGKEGGKSQKPKKRAKSPRKGPEIHGKGPKVDNQILTKIREIGDNSGS
jgi:hypothetical protein